MGRRETQERTYQIKFRESIAPSYSKISETGRWFLSDWEEARYQVGEDKAEQLDDEETEGGRGIGDCCDQR